MPPTYQTVHALTPEGTVVDSARFASWTSATGELVMWSEAAVVPHVDVGTRLRLTHGDYTFDGVVAEQWELYEGAQVAVRLTPYTPPEPVDLAKPGGTP